MTDSPSAHAEPVRVMPKMANLRSRRAAEARMQAQRGSEHHPPEGDVDGEGYAEHAGNEQQRRHIDAEIVRVLFEIL
jgi:hypothetical protein